MASRMAERLSSSWIGSRERERPGRDYVCVCVCGAKGVRSPEIVRQGNDGILYNSLPAYLQSSGRVIPFKVEKTL